jgi:hypothetical protein
MVTTAKFLFVARGDWIFQYDVNTLELLRKAEIPSNLQDDKKQADRVKLIRERLTEPAAVEPPPAPPEPPEPPEPIIEEPVIEEVVLGDRPASGVKSRRAGSQGRAQPVRAGLNWLAKHQDKDGRWDADRFMKHDEGQPSTGPGSSTHDVGVTGLAMLAMLGEGSTLTRGPYKANLKRAVAWLQSQQAENGRFGTDAAHDFIYDHAIATFAICEAYGLSQFKQLKTAAQSGINYLESHRNTHSVWRYQPRDNDNDISVTSWCLMACASAKYWQLQVNQGALDLGASYLDMVTTPDGRHGYTKGGERSSRLPGEHSEQFPTEKAEALTAAGLYCRLVLGQKPAQQPAIPRAAKLLVAKPPKWGEDEGTIDFYYWFYGTFAMFRMGGEDQRTWNEHLREAVLVHQVKKGSASGSWDPAGVWGEIGGRVASTALAVLSLEAYFRYNSLIR